MWRDHAAFEVTQLARFCTDLCDRLAQHHSAAAHSLVDRLPVDWVAVDTAAVVSVAEETGPASPPTMPVTCGWRGNSARIL